MRRRLLVVFAAMLTACGSSLPTDGTTTPPPPPSGPPSATPASVTTMAGEGQLAEPLAAVAVLPSVIVKDASGAPVSGASVSFAVDSGGGSLTGAVVTTGSNGIAIVGSWTMGPAEGRNVLKATVGTLAPIRIAATARIVATNFPTTTIGSGGGSITVTQPGPLNGFKLDVPGGAFTAGITATVSYASNASIPRTPTMNPLSPLITISTTATGSSSKALSIHINAQIPANTFPVIMVYDQASGATEVLSTIAWDATGVTASTTTLNVARLLDGTSATLRAKGASLLDNSVPVFVDGMPYAVLMRDYDSGFRPGVDDWEFSATPTELVQASGQTNPLGPVASALWYFNKKPSPVKLNGRFMLQPGVPFSDRVGIRWAAVLGDEYDEVAQNVVADALLNKTGGTFAGYSQNQFMLVRSRFAHDAENGGTPKPVLLAGNATPEAGEDAGQSQYMIAYRVSGDRIYVADPFWPGDATRSLEFPSGSAMAPYTNAGRVHTATLTNAATLGLTTLMPLDQLPLTYAQVLDGSIGKSRFPTDELHGWDGRLYDTLYVVDTLRVWEECAHCTYGFTTSLSPAPSAHLASGQFYRLDQPVHLLGSFPTGGFLFSAADVPGPDIPIGNAVGSAYNAQQVFVQDKSYSWVDWHPFLLRKLVTSIAPTAPTGAVNVPIALTHQVNVALLPSSVTYRWDFGDNTAKATVHNVNTVNHTYTAAGTYPATAEIIDDRNNQVIGRSTTTVTVVTAVIDLTVAGNWPNNSAPSLGSYHYTDLHGSRAANAAAGIDALLIDFDPYTPDNVLFNFGITFVVVVPAGSALHAGQTFTKWVSGPTSVGVGQFNLVLAGDLAHPENGTVIGANSGTFTITAVYPLSDGSTALSFTFSVSNGLGGTVSGSGVWGYR